jgi:hypothetical protein
MSVSFVFKMWDVGCKEDMILWYGHYEHIESILPRFIQLLKKDRVLTFKVSDESLRV